MANSFLSIESNLKVVDKASLDLVGNLRLLSSGTKQATTNFAAFNTAIKDQSKVAGQAAQNLKLIGTAAIGTGKALAGLAFAALTIQSIVTLGTKGYESFKQFNSVTKTLTFSEAISGSDKLSQNFAFLEKTADNLGNKIALSLQILTDNQGFNKFASGAVAAFGEVEEAAYKLSTITVSGTERSIDALDRNIAGMKKLQKETGFALDSVTLLNAQYDIASAGFTSTQDTQKVGKASVDLSQAGFGNLGGSTNAVVRVLSSLGEGADDAQKRAAQLFETTKVGLLTLDQLAGNIGSLSSQGKQLGVSFEEINTSLAVLTTQGVSTDEAATKLASFLGDVVSLTPDAQKALAQFRDEAGKPIQLNATTLKEKGIGGIIKDLKTATNGELSKIQQVFSNQSSQEFATLLIGAGEDKFKNFKGRITNADSSGLEEEAKNRDKTLKGGFTSALNESQSNVENFGQSFSKSVIQQLEESNTLLAGFSTGSASALGGFLGTLNGIQSKLSGIGSFIVAAFSVVAPLALFTVATKGIGLISAKFNGLKKDGETVFQTFKRLAISAAEEAENRIIALIVNIQRKIKDVKNEIAQIESGGKKTVPNSPLKSSLPQNFQLPDAKSVNLKPKGSLGGFLAGEAGELAGRGTLNGLKVLGTTAKATGTAVRAGIGVAGQVASAAASQFGALAVGGGLAVAGLSVVGGLADTLGKTLNRNTIPEIQTLKDTLSSIEGVTGLKESLAEFDEFTSGIQNSNVALNLYGESLERLKGLFNNITGKGGLNVGIQQDITDRQGIIGADTKKQLAAGGKGRLDATTVDEKNVNKKLDLGIELNPEDLNVVQTALDGQIKANKTLVSLQEQKIASEKSNGGGNPQAVEALQAELKTLKEKNELENASLEKQKQFLLYKNKIAGFKNIKTDVPIDIQIAANSVKSAELQISTLAKDFNEAFSGNGIDPEKLSAKLDNIIPRISQSLDTIQAQIDIDPSSATKLRRKLESSLGANLTKYLANDPALRKKYNETLQLETAGNVTKAQTKETGRVTAFDTAQNQGLDNAVLSAVKFRAETESINSQVRALTDELSKPTVPLQRQLELQGQIEQLEAKRVQASSENRIKQELSAKQQIQSIDTQILSVEQAKIALYSQQGKFDLFSISAAKAKLNESTKQLQINRQQIALSTQESLIKKEEAIKGLEGKVNRDSGVLSKLGKIETLPKSNIQAPVQVQAPLPDTRKQLAVIEDKRKNQVAETTTTTFSNEEQSQLSSAVNSITDRFLEGFGEKAKRVAGLDTSKDTQKRLFSNGKLTIPKEELNKLLLDGLDKENTKAKGKSLFGLQIDPRATLAGARSILDVKKVEAADNVNKINASATEDKKTIATKSGEDTSKGDAERKAQLEKVSGAKKNVSESKEGLAGAKKELLFQEVLAGVTARFGTLKDVIQINIDKINAEFSVREKLVKGNAALGEATSAIGSTLSSISSIPALGRLGNQLSNIGAEKSNATPQILLDRDKALKSVDISIKASEDLFAETTKALELAKSKGASKDVIARLEQTNTQAKTSLGDAKSEGDISKAQINQQTSLELINEKLKIFASRVNVANEEFNNLKERLSKQASLFSDVLDLNQRQKDNSSENNKSISGLQTSILGFFSKNNPAATALSQRIQVKQVDDEATQQKSQIVSEAKKEILDTTVQKNQLQLDSKMFANALTQTQILADILSVSQGGEATNSTTAEALKRIQQIPDAIKENQSFSSAQQKLLDQKLNFIPRETDNKLRRVDLDTAGKQLGVLGSTINPANVDLVDKSIKRAQSAGNGLKRETVDVGSLQDQSFTSMLRDINSVSNGSKFNTNVAQYVDSPQSNTVNRELLRTSRELQSSNRQDTIKLQQNLAGNTVRQKGGGGGSITIAPQQNFTFTISSEQAKDRGANFEQQMRSVVSGAVTDANRNLANEVLKYAKSF